MIKSFLKRLVFIKDRDVRNLVDLVKTCNPVLDQLSQLDCGLNSVGNTLDHDTLCVLLTEEVVCALEVPADTHGALDTDFI